VAVEVAEAHPPLVPHLVVVVQVVVHLLLVLLQQRTRVGVGAVVVTPRLLIRVVVVQVLSFSVT